MRRKIVTVNFDDAQSIQPTSHQAGEISKLPNKLTV